MNRVRPSSLQLAEKCSRAPWLSHRYREQNVATERGNAVDAELSIALTGGDAPTSSAGIALLAWVRAQFPTAEYYVQRRVRLIDPETLETLSEGTPDLVVVEQLADGSHTVVIVDWKSKGQFYAGHMAMPDDNLQQLTYLVAAGMDFGAVSGRVVLATFDERGHIDPIEGQPFPIDSWDRIIARVKSIPAIDPDGQEPEASKGDHCDSCYQKMHCSAYLLPVIDGAPVALAPFAEGETELTHAAALDGIVWLERAKEAVRKASKICDLVEGQLQTFATAHGAIAGDDGREWGPSPVAGRRSGPTVKDLEEMGLTNLIKTGKPGVKFAWRRGEQ